MFTITGFAAGKGLNRDKYVICVSNYYKVVRAGWERLTRTFLQKHFLSGSHSVFSVFLRRAVMSSGAWVSGRTVVNLICSMAKLELTSLSSIREMSRL